MSLRFTHVLHGFTSFTDKQYHIVWNLFTCSRTSGLFPVLGYEHLCTVFARFVFQVFLDENPEELVSACLSSQEISWLFTEVTITPHSHQQCMGLQLPHVWQHLILPESGVFIILRVSWHTITVSLCWPMILSTFPCACWVFTGRVSFVKQLPNLSCLSVD